MSGRAISQSTGGQVPPAPIEDNAAEPANSEGEASDRLGRLLYHLEKEYDLLLARLTSPLRSSDTAAEALHDVYLKLGRAPGISEVRSPIAYLFRMAMNLAKNSRRRKARFMPVDPAAVVDVEDEAPDPERAAAARDLIYGALAASSTVPGEQRAIFLARWRDERSHADMAAEFGLLRRTVPNQLE